MDLDLKEYLVNMESRMLGRLDAGAQAFTANLADLRTELVTRFDIMERRMDSMERTVGHLSLTVSQVDVKVTSLNRLIVGVQNDSQAVLGNQAALQRIVDDLATRVKKLEDDRRAA